MASIRERIEANNQGRILDEWYAGNLIPADDPLALAMALQVCLKDADPKGVRVPADEVQPRIDAAVAEAVEARDAEWRKAFHNGMVSERATELFGPRGPEEAGTFIKEDVKFAAALERERCARIAETFRFVPDKGYPGNSKTPVRLEAFQMIAAAIRQQGGKEP